MPATDYAEAPSQPPSGNESIDQAHPSSNSASHGFHPELVFAIVRAVGTPDDVVLRRLTTELQSYGYGVEHIGLSGLLQDLAADDGAQVPQDEAERVKFLIQRGDSLCQGLDLPEVVALLALQEVRAHRVAQHRKNAQAGDDIALSRRPVTRQAYILDSLKRVAEVTVLREIYGDRLVLLGLRANQTTRKDSVREKVRAARSEIKDKELDMLAEELFDLDEREPGRFGQDVQRTLPLADVFINVDDNPEDAVERLLRLMFGDPKYCPPTAPEYGMAVASLAETRSPELGRKVGAALVTENYEVIAQGANVNNVQPGSPGLDEGVRDIRALVLDTLRQLAPNLNEVTRQALEADGESLARDLLAGSLKDGQIVNLTEFQRPVHAEMSTLMSALRSRSDISNAVMYVTAEPCHNCSKHLLDLGLSTQYLTPYPKGRAAVMFGADIVAEHFQPFNGIAPRRYRALFEVTADRKTTAGVRKPFNQKERKEATPSLDPFVAAGLIEREDAALDVLAVRRAVQEGS